MVYSLYPLLTSEGLPNTGFTPRPTLSLPPGRLSLNEYTDNTIAVSFGQVTVFEHLSDSAETENPFATKNTR
jgi:hypothetical protein